MDAVWNHPAMVAIRTEVSRFVWTIERHVQSVEPMTWILVAIAMGAVWMFWVRPPK
jgi:hypothetical protein